MVSKMMKSLPLAILLASTALTARGDEPSEKKHESRVIVSEDGVFSTDGGDSLVVRIPGHGRRGYLGVRLLEMTQELREHFGAPRDAGVLVAGVEADSPAQKAGIQVGDIITKAGGDPVETARDLARSTRGMKSGETLKVEVSRNRAASEISVTVQALASREIDLGNLGAEIGRDFGHDFGREFGRHAWVFRAPEDVDRFQRRMDELDKRMKELEKRLTR
jgi:membrane-associated protease RseP (regulator of RpoE activity)